MTIICAHELMEALGRPSGKSSMLTCCLFPSRAVQHILLYLEAVNRREVILKIHFDSV